MADGITCDCCGKGLLIDADVRYEVRIVVKAAYDPLELTSEDLKHSRRAEIERLIERLQRMSPEEAQDQVYREFSFDLCPACQREYLRHPLGTRRTPRGRRRDSRPDAGGPAD
jgi:hypothetical protein